VKKGFKRELRAMVEKDRVKGFKLEVVVWREKKKKETRKKYGKKGEKGVVISI
jgi:hypothetical protein